MVKIRECKKEVRELLRGNYWRLLPPCVFYCLTIIAQNLILNCFTFQDRYLYSSDLLYLLIFAVLLICSLVLKPLAMTVFFRTFILVRNGRKNEISSCTKCFFGFKNIGKITLIYLIPSLLDLFLKQNNINYSAYNFTSVRGLPFYVIWLLSLFVTYKFFAVGYVFALHGGTVKETVLTSFKTMRRAVGRFLRLHFLAYFHWLFLMCVVMAIITFIVDDPSAFNRNIYRPFFDSLAPVGFGATAFIEVLRYSLCAVFIDNKLFSDREEKQKGI